MFTLPAVVAGVSVLAACSAQPQQGAAHSQGGAVAMPPGQLVYVQSCSRCHGVDGEGKTDAPALSTVRMASLGDQPLRMTISYGKGRMPAFGGLSTAQVDELINYLKARS